MSDVTALLIFCEGSHDCAFTRMILRNLMDYEIAHLKFAEMPSPFRYLFETSINSHAAQDMSLDMEYKFFLPDTVLRKESNIIFLFNCGGKTEYQKIKTFLSSYLPLQAQAATFAYDVVDIVVSSKYLFLYDADTDGIEKTITVMNTEFKKIDKFNFIDGIWEDSLSPFGKTDKDKAVFIWGETPEKGTLEDIVVPLFEIASATLYGKAKQAMSDMSNWETKSPDPKKAVVETAKFKKAIVTTLGQRKAPGGSYNVILEHSKLVSENILKSSRIVTEFVEFLKEFLNG